MVLGILEGVVHMFKKFLSALVVLLVPALICIAAEEPAPVPDPAPAIEKAADDVKFNEPIEKPDEKPALVPYNDRNAAALNAWLQQQKELPCGIACPKCQTELLRNMAVLLNTQPPMAIVRCAAEGCGFSGAIY
jgi:hypothetical protein